MPEADPLESLTWLIGEWRGEGRGSYPTISDFAYREEVAFSRPRPDKPFLAYTQRTRLIPDDVPSHSETGYLRAVPGGAELVIAQPTGVVEVHEGTVDDGRLAFATIAVLSTPTAKEITDVRRTLERRGDDLWYQIEMAAVGQALTFHLEATLQRMQ